MHTWILVMAAAAQLSLTACGAASAGPPILDEATPLPVEEPPSQPHVVRIVPEAGAMSSPNASVRVVFSEPMDSEVTPEAFSMRFTRLAVPGTFFWDSTGAVLAFRPETGLAEGDYAIRVSTAALSREGISLQASVSSEFSVVTAQHK